MDRKRYCGLSAPHLGSGKFGEGAQGGVMKSEDEALSGNALAHQVVGDTVLGAIFLNPEFAVTFLDVDPDKVDALVSRPAFV